MKKYILTNLSTKEEVTLEAETLAIACAKLGWIPSMIDAEVEKKE